MEAIKLNPTEKLNQEPKGKTTKEKVRNTYTAELIFGVCAPIGSSREVVVETIKQILITDYQYEVEIIKLSEYIGKNHTPAAETIKGETKTYTTLMNKIKGGDELRKK